MKGPKQLPLFGRKKRPKTVVGKKCLSPKNRRLSKIADYLLASADQQDTVDGINVKSIYLTESQAPRTMDDWQGIFAQMRHEHYLVPTGEENRYYVFTDKREGTAFVQRLKHPAKSAAA